MYLFTTGMLLLLATFGCLGITYAAPEHSSVGQLSEADPSAHVSGSILMKGSEVSAKNEIAYKKHKNQYILLY